MGMEIVINSIDEMCDLMCDNIIPRRRTNREKNTESLGNETHEAERVSTGYRDNRNDVEQIY